MGDLIIEACHRRQCFSVGIVDTRKVEEDENFYVSLMRTEQLDPLIKIGSRTKTNVTIRDDDSKLERLMCCHMTKGAPSHRGCVWSHSSSVQGRGRPNTDRDSVCGVVRRKWRMCCAILYQCYIQQQGRLR